ncbi:MAG: hypothetical protein JNJ57_22045 [Saprospiraceae bacterium]|nr:hypothetical protein [Saprospiraceae bacterium]
MKQHFSIPVLILLLFGSIIFSCKHNPFFEVDPDPNPPGGGACDPDSIYFQNAVLPLLVSNCTESGCHNATDQAEDIVLVSYESVMSTVGHITDTNWGENKLIKSLQETDLEDRMPQGKPAFTSEQINLIKTWISQGAQNNSCDESFGVCDTLNGSQYGTFVVPLVQNKCKGCHSGANPQGGLKLTTYAEIKAVALNGKLYNSLIQASNWMPKGGARLDDCSLAKVRIWVNNGAPEN